MAVTTVSNPIRLVDTGVYSFFGYPLPKNISAATMQDDLLNNMKKVRWRVKGDPEIHEMDFPHATEENILAIIAAMRLSC